MSTNNNRLGKETQPIWNIESSDGKESRPRTFKKLSGLTLQRLMRNNAADCTALPLSELGITKIEDFSGFGDNLRRVDLSQNEITRLHGFSNISKLSFLNISSNNFSGDSGLEDLRYLSELRTLNIGKNPDIKGIKSHIMKPLLQLQALICNKCGLEKSSFIRFLPKLNTLVLSHNSLKSFDLRDLKLTFSFTLLNKLSLGHNSIDVFPDLFPSMPSLNEIRLNNNLISDIPIEFITFYSKKLKIFDISCNRLSDWNQVERLSGLSSVTNLTLKGNPLPALPASVEEIFIKEDVSASTVSDPMEKRYRINVLNIFQKRVGALQKHFVQLVVLDNKRVKTKWTQGGAHREEPKQEQEQDQEEFEGNTRDQDIGTTKKRRHEESFHSVEKKVIVADTAFATTVPDPAAVSIKKKRVRQDKVMPAADPILPKQPLVVVSAVNIKVSEKKSKDKSKKPKKKNSLGIACWKIMTTSL